MRRYKELEKTFNELVDCINDMAVFLQKNPKPAVRFGVDAKGKRTMNVVTLADVQKHTTAVAKKLQKQIASLQTKKAKPKASVVVRGV